MNTTKEYQTNHNMGTIYLHTHTHRHTQTHTHATESSYFILLYCSHHRHELHTHSNRSNDKSGNTNVLICPRQKLDIKPIQIIITTNERIKLICKKRQLPRSPINKSLIRNVAQRDIKERTILINGYKIPKR